MTRPDAFPSPFHPGEVSLQRSLGLAERMDAFGRRVIRDFMPDQHREFYAQLPFVVAGTVDDAGDAWITLLAGQNGFIASPDPQTLVLTGPRDPQDPAAAGIADGAAIGLLGIALDTRRRNRMNGTIAACTTTAFTVRTEHAFGNCPQYIQLRRAALVRDPADFAALPEAVRTEGLDDDARRRIAAADTFFVASYLDDPAGRHVDASHRGGKAGFVRVNADGSLTIPDFAGNRHFNTLGNFLLNPRAGLVFPDFTSGDLLQLTGDADVELDDDAIAGFRGAERLWTFRPRAAVLRRAALPLRWELDADGWSPSCLRTGAWE